MIITAFNGSHQRGNGNTWTMVEAFLRGAAGRGAETRQIELVEKRLEHCRACKACWFKTPGSCPLPDDGPGLLAAYTGSDVVVFASPLYVDNVTGLMKVFFDRLIAVGDPHWDTDQHGESVHRARYPKPRKLVVIMNGGYPEQTNFEHLRLLFRRMARNLHVELAGEIYRGAGGLLAKHASSMKPSLDAYLHLVQKAGEELVDRGAVSYEMQTRLEGPLLPISDFSKWFREKVNEVCDGNMSRARVRDAAQG
jgi:multimeric flavodoxin WrbA